MAQKEYIELTEIEMATLMRVVPDGYKLHFGLGGFLNVKSCPEAYRELLVIREQLCPDFLMVGPGVNFNG